MPWAIFNESGGSDQFAGHKVDEETGLKDFGARYYNPTTKRWNTADSLTAHIYDPQSLNKYAYVRNDPVNLVDPDGRAWGVVEPDDFTFRVTVSAPFLPTGLVNEWELPFSPRTGYGETNLGAASYYAGRQIASMLARENLSTGYVLVNALFKGDLGQRPDCEKDLAAISALIPSSNIQDLVSKANWESTYSNQTPAIGLFVPGSQLYYLFLAHQPVGQTISSYVSRSTTAAAALPGSPLSGNIYYQPDYVASISPDMAAALTIHEASHSGGALDGDMMKALGLTGTSSAITDKLYEDCFK